MTTYNLKERLHKEEAYRKLISLIDSSDFKSKLERLFNSELGYYHRKQSEGVVYYLNNNDPSYGKRFVRFSAHKTGNVNETYGFTIYLQDDYSFKKEEDSYVSDWSGYSWNDIFEMVCRDLNLGNIEMA